MKLMIVEDHQLMLEGLKNYLESLPFFEVVGAFDTEEAFLAAFKKTNVDIVLMDYALKEGTAFDLIQQLKRIERPLPKIMLLSGLYNENLHKRALELGVAAFLPKEVGYTELVAVLQNVGAGYTTLPPQVLPKLQDPFLTEREQVILQLVADERTNEQIAKTLFLSRRTIEGQLAVIFQKLGVQTRVGAVKEGIRMQLVE